MPRLVKRSLSCASTQLLTRAARCQVCQAPNPMLFLLVSCRVLSADGHCPPALVHASATPA